MGVSKNRGKTPPNHPFVHRVFHYKPSILGGKIPLFLETPTSRFPISLKSAANKSPEKTHPNRP